MKLSQRDRNGLLSRVEQRLGGRAVTRVAIQGAIDQVLATLAVPDESPAANQLLFVLSAESMPDLASRVRQKMSSTRGAPFECGTATAGRFTVVTMRVSADARASLEQTAKDLRASLTVVDPDGAAGDRT